MKRLTWSLALLLGVFVSFLVSIWLGAVDFTLSEIVAVLTGGGEPNVRRIVLELRAPRATLAILVGGGLALAGAVFQALLRNPLAEPYILGNFWRSCHWYCYSFGPRDLNKSILGSPSHILCRSTPGYHTCVENCSSCE